jgi:hypothetical protein
MTPKGSGVEADNDSSLGRLVGCSIVLNALKQDAYVLRSHILADIYPIRVIRKNPIFQIQVAHGQLNALPLILAPTAGKGDPSHGPKRPAGQQTIEGGKGKRPWMIVFVALAAATLRPAGRPPPAK